MDSAAVIPLFELTYNKKERRDSYDGKIASSIYTHIEPK